HHTRSRRSRRSRRIGPIDPIGLLDFLKLSAHFRAASVPEEHYKLLLHFTFAFNIKDHRVSHVSHVPSNSNKFHRGTQLSLAHRDPSSRLNHICHIVPLVPCHRFLAFAFLLRV
ncbi:MAG: hypothetical protein ACK56I_00085, partial [bacterium]